MNPSTTSDNPVARTTTLAMLAVAQHAADRHFEVWGIEAPDFWRSDNQGVVIRVPDRGFDAWAESLSSPTPTAMKRLPNDFVALSCHGWIPSPIGDVRVTLRTNRKVTPLRSVTFDGQDAS